MISQTGGIFNRKNECAQARSMHNPPVSLTAATLLCTRRAPAARFPMPPLCKGGIKGGIVTRHKPHICPRGARYAPSVRKHTVGADRIRPPQQRTERNPSLRHSRMCRRATAKKILPRGEDQTDQNCSRLIPISGSGLRSTAPGRIRITISQVAETTARFRCPPKTSHRAFPALMCRC